MSHAAAMWRCEYRFFIAFTNRIITHRGCEDIDLKIKTLVIHECPLWSNASINRELNQDEIKVVVDDFIKR